MATYKAMMKQWSPRRGQTVTWALTPSSVECLGGALRLLLGDKALHSSSFVSLFGQSCLHTTTSSTALCPSGRLLLTPCPTACARSTGLREIWMPPAHHTFVRLPGRSAGPRNQAVVCMAWSLRLARMDPILSSCAAVGFTGTNIAFSTHWFLPCHPPLPFNLPHSTRTGHSTLSKLSRTPSAAASEHL